MFVAPLLPPTATTRASARACAAPSQPAPVATLAVVAWLVAGVSAIVLFPTLRDGPTLGVTIPFWLVAAPAIDLAWLARGRVIAALRRAARRPRRRPPSQARRLQSARRPVRSSR